MEISIHALREEGDDLGSVVSAAIIAISIHALREEGDSFVIERGKGGLKFLSTPSARRATRYNNRMPRRAGDFYPRPPRGGRPVHPQQPLWAREISIHALREEGDGLNAFRITAASYFYPRPPRGGRRSTLVRFPLIRWHFYPRPPRGGRLDVYGILADYTGISIHALREEGDFLSISYDITIMYFYPRPPRGGRLHGRSLVQRGQSFLSTPSARRATRKPWPEKVSQTNFYPRPPRGGRHASQRAGGVLLVDFYPRPPRGGRPRANSSSPRRSLYFYPRPPRGGRPYNVYDGTTKQLISIHALREEGDSKNGEKHLRFCFIIKRSAQIWKSLSKNIRKKSRDLHRMP